MNEIVVSATQSPSLSLAGLAGSFWRNRQLVWQLTVREMQGRYRGSWLGMIWAFLTPLLMLGVYTFVFAVIFNAKWGARQIDDSGHFAVVLFAGLIVYTLFAECINRSPSLIVASPSYVKKVIFPLELLPLPVLCSALLHGGVSLIVLLLAMLVTGMALPWTLILLPIVLLPLVLAILGLMWLLGSLGVYIRDIAQVVVPLTSALLFLAPIFYPVSAVPDAYRPLLEANPLTFVIESARAVVIGGLVPDFATWAIQVAAGVVVFWCGYAWFQRARKGFADVL